LRKEHHCQVGAPLVLESAGVTRALVVVRERVVMTWLVDASVFCRAVGRQRFGM